MAVNICMTLYPFNSCAIEMFGLKQHKRVQLFSHLIRYSGKLVLREDLVLTPWYRCYLAVYNTVTGCPCDFKQSIVGTGE